MTRVIAEAPGNLSLAERSEETREHLLAEARRLFTRHGYAGASTTQIVRAIGVSRGALHHHFPHKRALFEAVYREVSQELSERLKRYWDQHRFLSRWERLHCVLQAALDQATDPAVQQIVVIDAPSVLQLPRCHQTSHGASYERLRRALEDAQQRGLLDEAVATDAAAYMLFGACANAAHWIATAEDARGARRDAGRMVAGLLESLRRQER